MIRPHSTDELVSHLTAENANLRKQLDSSESEYQKLFQWADLVSRTIRNGKMSPAYRLLYISLVDAYPAVFVGNRTEIQVHSIRENAGWISKRSANDFLRDMESIAALEYNPGSYNQKENARPGYIKANPDIFPYPESFDMQSAERKRKAREREEKKRNEIKHQLQILECEMCGSASIVNDVIAKCTSCGHVHDPILGVPSALITIEAEVVELPDGGEEEEDDFLDQAPAPRQAPVTISALPLQYSTHPPESLQRPNDLCKLCKRTRRECYVPVTDAPGIWTFSCM